MPNCLECGSLYGTGDEFCPECGERLIVKGPNFLILIAIVVIIGVVLLFALKTPKTSSINSAELPTAMSTAVPTSEEEIHISEEMLRELQIQYENERDLLREGFTSIDSELQKEYEYETDLLREQLNSILDELEAYEAGIKLINQAEQEETNLRELYFEKVDELTNRAQQEEIKLTQVYTDGENELINQAQYRDVDLVDLYDSISEDLSTQAHEANLGLIDLYGELSEELSKQAHEGGIRLIGLYQKISEEGYEDGKYIDKPIQEPQEQCIAITNFHFNAAGDDNYNLNDEYVIFRNKCSYSIDMTDWTVRDETDYHVYTFPSFTFKGGATFTLYTGAGVNTDSALYWGRTAGAYAAIWNNQEGDTLFLRDSNGNLILSEIYTGY